MTQLRASLPVRAMIIGIGRRVRDIRVERGMTQRELARKAYVNHRFISAFELGKMNCSLVTLHYIAEALGCPLVALIPRAATDDSDVQVEDEPIAA